MSKDLSQQFKESFQENTDQELIAIFNRYVGNRGWCSAKGIYLAALREEISKRDFDNTSIIISGGLSLSRRVMLIANRLEFAPSDS
ncbi:MAG: hypothetical protein GX857_12710 [Bacteroidales bacterium]|jgi:hypothetical protein|nr:hypothetical protein [Bacteroidales bacterium]